MKNLLFATLLLMGIIVANCAKAQQTNADANAPAITFDMDTIDYGTIAHNTDGNRVFKFTNTGKEPLIIKEAHGSCQCTLPSWPHEPIQPGEAAEIKVHYNTGNVGRFVKTVTITSNAVQSTKIIWIIGNVLPDSQPTVKVDSPK
jgi:hypothetical protein